MASSCSSIGWYLRPFGYMWLNKPRSRSPNRYKQAFRVYKGLTAGVFATTIFSAQQTTPSNMAPRFKRRRNAISAFLIPSSGQTMGVGDWSSYEPKAVWYGWPEESEYQHPSGGTYVRCRVEAFGADKETLGYLPLPRRYTDAWVQLCYNVVYWISQWKAWVAEKDRPSRLKNQPAGMAQECADNSGVRLLQYLAIRRLVVEELLQHHMSKDGSDQLRMFDEYLIRERFNWLWTDFEQIPVSKRGPLKLDPVHPANKTKFRECRLSFLSCRAALDETLSPEWTGSGVPQEMLAPAASPGHTWIWGSINHFDVQALFDQGFPDLIEFYRNTSFQDQVECPYDDNAEGLPDRWYEAQEPAVHFLTAEEDEHFNNPG